MDGLLALREIKRQKKNLISSVILGKLINIVFVLIYPSDWINYADSLAAEYKETEKVNDKKWPLLLRKNPIIEEKSRL
ncbi:hypothetical protein P4L29_18385 [Bacillus cereus]|nr:hypothetical protein [Bacillus cereus]